VLNRAGALAWASGPDRVRRGRCHVAGVGSCFCGRGVEPGLVDPVTLTVKARSDRRRDNGFAVRTMYVVSRGLSRGERRR